MPYEIKKVKDYFVVVSDKGNRVGKHNTRGGALRQMRALYAHVPEARNDKTFNVFFEGRRTGNVVEAEDREKAKPKARKKKKRGGKKVTSVRELHGTELKQAREGKWVRSGPKGEKPGYGGKRGYGPAPKGYKKDEDDAANLRFITLEELEQITLPVEVPVFEIQRSDREPLYGIGFENEETAEENYLNYWRLENYTGIIPILPEGSEEVEPPYNFDGANWHYNLDKKAGSKKFSEAKVKRDKLGRFARKAGSKDTSTKKELPTRINSQTNIADLGQIAKSLGIKDKPEKYPNRRESWRQLIREKGGEKGAEYFKPGKRGRKPKAEKEAISAKAKTSQTTATKQTTKKSSKSTESTTKQEKAKTKTTKTKSSKPKESSWEKQKKESSGLTELGSQKTIPQGTYENNGKKIKISEQSDSGYQDIKIDGVPSIYTKDTHRNAVKETVDHYSSPILGSKHELGKAYDIRSRPAIKNQKEFDKEFNEAYDKLNEEFKYDDLVPVYKVRRALGDRVTRKQFDDYVWNMPDIIPQGGSVEDSESTKIMDSMQTELDGLRTYVARETRY